VLAPLDFLGYLTTLDDQLAVLAVARAHLRSGGLLALDVAFPPGAFGGQVEGVLVHQWTHREPTGEVVSKWWVRAMDAAAQLQHLTGFYDVVAPDGTLRRWVQTLVLRYYHRYELELLLARADFAVEGVYGSYALDELTTDSSRQVVLARPAAEPGARSADKYLR
jgi:hypothetical protein